MPVFNPQPAFNAASPGTIGGTTPGIVNAASIVVNGTITGTGIADVNLASNFTNNSNVQTAITGFSFAIGANEKWEVDLELVATGTTAAGAKYAVTGPSSPTSVRYSLSGETSGLGTFSSEQQTSFAATPAITFSGGSGTAYTGVTKGKLIVVNGANAGTIQFTAASTSNGTSVPILINSMMCARRIP